MGVHLSRLMTYDPATGAFLRLGWITRGGNFRAYDPPRKAGAVGANGYVELRIQGTLYYGHRLAWFCTHGEWPTGDIDHINGDRADNRLVNLRAATRAENMQNLRRATARNKVGLLGVRYDPRSRKFNANLKIDGQQTFLGSFDTPEEAHQRYVEAKRRHHEFATI
jgi:hypothetical protein